MYDFDECNAARHAGAAGTFRGRGNMSVESEKLRQNAQNARRTRRLDETRRDAAEAVRVCRDSGSTLELAKALTTLGQIERNLHHATAAVGHYEEAAVIYRQQRNPMRLAHAIRHVGDIHRHEGDREGARRCYAEALEIYRGQAATSPLDLANAIRGFALLLEATGEVAQARSLWLEAKQLYAQVNVQEGVAESSERLAVLAQP